MKIKVNFNVADLSQTYVRNIQNKYLINMEKRDTLNSSINKY